MGVHIKKNEENPESKEILAEAVVKIGAAMDELHRSGLNKQAIIVLIQAKTKISQRDIETVMDALKQLRGWYCR